MATIGLTGGAGSIASININGSPVAHLDSTGIISGLPFGNIIINPGFTINQRGYVSNAVLAAGNYGHDRWKAGASGGDYTFTQLNSNTTITIKTGKSLIQVVEDKNVQATRYVLSWEGTAQARYGVNSATPSGSYAASPIVITGQTAGTTMSVEFNEGTLGKVQLKAEPVGSVATPFETRSVGQELALCQRYYYRISPGAVSKNLCESGNASAATTTQHLTKFPVTMRIAPSAVEQSGTANQYAVASIGASITPCSSVVTHGALTTVDTAHVTATVASGLTAGQFYTLRTDATNGATAYLGWSAEL